MQTFSFLSLKMLWYQDSDPAHAKPKSWLIRIDTSWKMVPGEEQGQQAMDMVQQKI